VAAPLYLAATAASLRGLQALCSRIPITDRQTDRKTDITNGLHIVSAKRGKKKNDKNEQQTKRLLRMVQQLTGFSDVDVNVSMSESVSSATRISSIDPRLISFLHEYLHSPASATRHHQHIVLTHVIYAIYISQKRVI